MGKNCGKGILERRAVNIAQGVSGKDDLKEKDEKRNLERKEKRFSPLFVHFHCPFF